MARTPLEVIPVLHAQAGRLVGADGQPLGADLRELARRFKREHGALYLVDLDGLRKNRPDVGVVQELAARVPLWADAGSRFHQDVMDLIIAGAEQVTLRYETLRDESVVEETVRLTEQVALGLEFKDQALVQNRRWPATPPEIVDLAKRYQLPVVVVDLDRAGRADGIDRSVAWHARNHPHGAYFAGGVASRRDLETLDGLGYQGALVSTALIKGSTLEGAPWAGRVPEPGEAEGASAGEGLP